LARSIAARGRQRVLDTIPPTFRLNEGHVCFFYDKGAYMRERYAELVTELILRGIHDFDRSAPLDKLGIWQQAGMVFNRHYEPTEEALALVRDRIAAKIAMKPHWYRLNGVPLEVHGL